MSDDSGRWGWLNFLGVLFFLVLAGIIVYRVFLAGPEASYAAKFRVSADKVHIDPKPSDCDFMHAPLGDKDCHYEAAVAAFNAAGQLVGGDHAPRYVRGGHVEGSTEKTALVSHDDGKTWTMIPDGDVPDQKITSVIVKWSKVTD